jgi:hypothetical protein
LFFLHLFSIYIFHHSQKKENVDEKIVQFEEKDYFLKFWMRGKDSILEISSLSP